MIEEQKRRTYAIFTRENFKEKYGEKGQFS